MRIVFVSTNRLLHKQWDKAIESNVEVLNLYHEEDIKSFDFLLNDIVLFDYDNLNEYLNYLGNSKVVCLSSKLNEVEGFKLLKSGVKAYGNNYMTPMNLKEAIKTVINDKVWIYPELMSFIIENSTLNNLPKNDEKIEELSSRELDVSKLVSKGFTNKEIANDLGITERTVKAHISTIFSKLHIKDRVTLGIKIKEYLEPVK